MVKVITDKRECHCSAFNYCIDENCTCWAEIVRDIGFVDDEPNDDRHNQAEPAQLDPEPRY